MSPPHPYPTGSVPEKPEKLEKTLRKHLTTEKNRAKLQEKLEKLAKNRKLSGNRKKFI